MMAFDYHSNSLLYLAISFVNRLTLDLISIWILNHIQVKLLRLDNTEPLKLYRIRMSNLFKTEMWTFTLLAEFEPGIPL